MSPGCHLTSLLLVGTLAAVAMAQPTVIEAPVLGYVLDKGQGSLRPILGIPGATRIGEPIDLGIPLEQVEISPAQDYALGVTAFSDDVLLVRLGGGSATAEPIPGAIAGRPWMVLSPGGNSAALYHAGTGMQILGGLPRNPTIRAKWDLPGGIALMAVSDDGVAVAAICDEGGCSLLSPERLLARRGQISDLRFLPNSHDVLVTDFSRSEVLLLRDVAGAGDISVLASQQEGVFQPIAALLERERRRLFVVNRGSDAITAVDLESGRSSTLPCDCRPSRLDALHGGAVFRLTGAATDPLFLLDLADQPRIVFVPPPASSRVPPRSRGQR